MRVRGWLPACLLIVMSACASVPFEAPAPFDDAALRERSLIREEEGVRVSAVIPTREESLRIFGVDLSAKRIEPVWLEIENRTERRLRFFPTGMDPEYFAPLEVAFGFRKQFSGDTYAAIDAHFESLNFKDPIRPGETVSGFVFTNTDTATKVVSVDLIGRKWTTSITLLLPIPGQQPARERVARISASEAGPGKTATEDESRLRSLLEELPCCVSSATGERAEPLNIVVIGALEEWATAFQHRGYRIAPLSPRYLFGQRQDVSGTKRARWVPAQPHQVRLWLTDIRYQGTSVWVGQVSTPLGGRFAPAADGEVELPTDPDVDEARIDLVQDIIYSQSLARLGFVKGVGRVTVANPRTTPTGSTYHTDGLRAVFLFTDEGVALSEIGFFEWERLIDHYRRQVDAALP